MTLLDVVKLLRDRATKLRIDAMVDSADGRHYSSNLNRAKAVELDRCADSIARRLVALNLDVA